MLRVSLPKLLCHPWRRVLLTCPSGLSGAIQKGLRLCPRRALSPQTCILFSRILSILRGLEKSEASGRRDQDLNHEKALGGSQNHIRLEPARCFHNLGTWAGTAPGTSPGFPPGTPSSASELGAPLSTCAVGEVSVRRRLERLIHSPWVCLQGQRLCTYGIKAAHSFGLLDLASSLFCSLPSSLCLSVSVSLFECSSTSFPTLPARTAHSCLEACAPLPDSDQTHDRHLLSK